MSTKPVIVVIHGMGKHPVGQIVATFAKSIDDNLQQIDQYKNASITDLADLEEINYDGFFDRIRQTMADNAKPIADRLGQIGAALGLSFGPELVLKLASLESNYGHDKFFYTNCLDVIFYSTLLGAKVRVDAAEKIAQIIRDHSPDQDVHVVAHSLGTAVIHDTLAQLYRGDFIANDKIPDLDLQTHRLKSIWMVANVSRLMDGVTHVADPYRSSVKPGPAGCADYFTNVRHELDPITWIREFNPQDDGQWVPKDYFDYCYQCVVTSSVTNINTHDFGEYIRNPKVALPLLRQTLRIVPDKAESDKIFENFNTGTIQGGYDALKEAYRSLSPTNQASLSVFLQTATKFSQTIQALGQGA